MPCLTRPPVLLPQTPSGSGPPRPTRLLAQRTSSPALLNMLVGDCDAYTRLFVSRRSISIITPSNIIALFQKAGSLDTLTNDSDSSSPLTTEERKRLFEAGPWGRWLLARHPGTGENWLRRIASSFPDEACIRMEPTRVGFRPQRDTLKYVVADHEATPPKLREQLNEGRPTWRAWP